MEIKFTFRKKHYSISIGHDTPWFSQIPFIMFTEEIYDDSRRIQYARVIWTTPYKV